MRLPSQVRSDRLTELWVDAGGGRMFYRTNARMPPTTRPVILVHGFVISSIYMIPTAHEPAPLCPVYAPDLPGYGESSKVREVPGPEGLADALAGWMDKVGIQKADFLGNSYGCQILTEFAIRHEARTCRLILVGPTVDPLHRSVPSQALRLMLTSRYEDKSLSRLNRQDYRKAGLKQIAGTVLHCFRHRMEERLPLVSVPTLVIRGSRDRVVPQRWAEEVLKLLPRGELKVVPGAGHSLNYSHPIELVRTIRPFLNL
jgi:2-hydroxy-6-oxonona-2,4-dienedioate hydrolase